MGEKLIQFRRTRMSHSTSIARIIGAYGPNQDLDLSTSGDSRIFSPAIEYSAGHLRRRGDGEGNSSCRYVTDTVNTFLRAVEKSKNSRMVWAFNLGSEESITSRTSCENNPNPESQSKSRGIPLGRPAIWGRVLDCAFSRQLLTDGRPLLLCERACGDVTKISLSGWLPILQSNRAFDVLR